MYVLAWVVRPLWFHVGQSAHPVALLLLIVEPHCLSELIARLPLGYLLPTGFNGPPVFLICISVYDAMRNKSYKGRGRKKGETCPKLA